MYENLEQISLAAVPFYVIFFHIVTYAYTRDLWDMNPHSHELWDMIYKAGLRGEQVSFTLTGFAIIALVFVMTVFVNNLGNAELIVVFFSIGFFLEVFSAFMFHFFEKFGYQISASILQFGGLFAILLGFYTYFTSILEWSLYIQIVYIFGIVGFVILSGKELHVYIKYRNKKVNDE